MRYIFHLVWGVGAHDCNCKRTKIYHCHHISNMFLLPQHLQYIINYCHHISNIFLLPPHFQYIFIVTTFPIYHKLLPPHFQYIINYCHHISNIYLLPPHLQYIINYCNHISNTFFHKYNDTCSRYSSKDSRALAKICLKKVTNDCQGTCEHIHLKYQPDIIRELAEYIQLKYQPDIIMALAKISN